MRLGSEPAAAAQLAHQDGEPDLDLIDPRCVLRREVEGDALYEAKGDDGIPRGGWEKWVEREAGLSHETAKRNLQLFIAVSEDRVSIPDITQAGQIGALKAAREPEDDPPAPGPLSADELDRQAQAEAGRCVVANMHDGCDVALLMWVQNSDRFVHIDRRSEWGPAVRRHPRPRVLLHRRAGGLRRGERPH